MVSFKEFLLSETLDCATVFVAVVKFLICSQMLERKVSYGQMSIHHSLYQGKENKNDLFIS